MTEERLERERMAALAQLRANAALPAVLYERCRECDEALPPERFKAGFCCPECRDDFQKRASARLRQGSAPSS